MRRNRSRTSINRRTATKLLSRLSPLLGDKVIISFQPDLSADRGQLLSGSLGKGTPVHAACFIRKRQIVLETALLDDESLLRLILVHELFHFVWAKLNNRVRTDFADLLDREARSHAAGEIGESSIVRKHDSHRSVRARKEYVCESFCDTAAWLFAGVIDHATFQLAKRWQDRRRKWFQKAFERYWMLRCC